MLVQLRLDGGRYVNLVKQLSRVSKLKVTMAMPGDALAAGTVYVMPEGVGVADAGSGLAFIDDTGELIGVLPPQESAVLVLSGADSARVEAAQDLAGNGAWGAGQARDGCYDAAAVTLLAAGGAELGTPAQLAQTLVARWA